MAIMAAPPIAVKITANPFLGLGSGLLNVYLFLLFSRLAENLPSLHLGMIFMFLLLAIVPILNPSGAFTNRLSIPLFAFCAWLALSIPYSLWPGGSASDFRDWLKSFAVFVITTSLLTSVSACRTAIYAVAA